jgi:hypothetical protein
MICEQWMGKDVERSGRGLIGGKIPEFAFRTREKPRSILEHNTEAPAPSCSAGVSHGLSKERTREI